jgi:hypothetical protein
VTSTTIPYRSMARRALVKVVIQHMRHDPPVAFGMSIVDHFSGCREYCIDDKHSEAAIEYLQHVAPQSNQPIFIKYASKGK